MRKQLEKAFMKSRPNKTALSAPQPFNLLTIEPNQLRDRIYQAFSNLPVDQRAVINDKLIVGLEQFGVNVSSGLLILGIPAQTSDDLTPSDVAKLMRYLRINAPQALEAIASQLRELMATETAIQRLPKAA